MKKYLTIAAVLGAIAFLSVSYLAQAQQPPAAPAAPAAMAPAAAPAAPAAAGSYAKDRADCDALASAATTEGATPSAADKAVSLKKCLSGKGHSDAEIMQQEAAQGGAAPAAPAAPK